MGKKRVRSKKTELPKRSSESPSESKPEDRIDDIEEHEAKLLGKIAFYDILMSCDSTDDDQDFHGFPGSSDEFFGFDSDVSHSSIDGIDEAQEKIAERCRELNLLQNVEQNSSIDIYTDGNLDSKGKRRTISAAKDVSPRKKSKIDSCLPVEKPPKQLLRPSKLGSISPELSSSQKESVSMGEKGFLSTGMFWKSPSELMVEGKRKSKPSLKLQDNSVLLTSLTSEKTKKTVALYANAMAKSSVVKTKKKTEVGDENDVIVKNDLEHGEKIRRILASQWDSRITKGNKMGKLGEDISNDGEKSDHTKRPQNIIKKAKLELNKKLLVKLHDPDEQVHFYEAIQQSIQRADKSPPKLLESNTSINPAGTALVEEKSQIASVAKSLHEKSHSNNRMPGNIVCGICGAVRYYAFILQAKKFGTFSCEPCRKFISKMIRTVKSDVNLTKIPCLSKAGNCVVPPVSRTKGKSSATEGRCQSCWLKLCLIGYNLESSLYDEMRKKLLPKVIQEQLPTSDKRHENSLLPHRGEIFEFNRQVPLSRPLFEGFGSNNLSAQAENSKSKSMSESASNTASLSRSIEKKTANSQIQSQHSVNERLPNGWIKKAVKTVEGEQEGKWETFLITPDQKILNSPSDLKLYIAKSGAIVDSNLINFSLPKKIARVDKALSRKVNHLTESRKSSGQRISSVASEDQDQKFTQKNEAEDVIRRTSKRETKIPLKFREDEPQNVTSTKEDDASSNKNEVKLLDTSKKEKLILSPKKTGLGNPRTIGVGTFSIDTDDVKGSLVDLRLKTSKRTIACRKCENCLKKDCNKCAYCLDQKKNGGKGHLKKICVERRCIDPQMNGLPALSTFRRQSGIGEGNRSYIRVATALATKSIPPPPPSAEENSNLSKEDTKTVLSGLSDHDMCVSKESTPSRSASPTLTHSLPLESEQTTRSLSSQFDEKDKQRKPLAKSEDFTTRPSLSFAALIALALENLPGQEGTLQMIYQYLMDRFPYFRTEEQNPQWQNSIRHNLSLKNSVFVKGEKLGKSCLWRLAPNVNKEKLFKRKSTIKFDENSKGNIISGKSQSFSPESIEESSKTSKDDEQLPPPSGKEGRVENSESAGVDHKIDERRSLSLEEFLGIPEGSAETVADYLGLPHSNEPKTLDPETLSSNIDTFISLRDSPVKESLSSTPKRQKDVSTMNEAKCQVSGLNESNLVNSNQESEQKFEEVKMKSQPRVLGSMDFYQPYDPNEAFVRGHAVISTDDISGNVLCFLCGSSGKDPMVKCAICCEPYHESCVQELHPELNIDSDGNGWTCERCAMCQICGQILDDPLKRCKNCGKSYHESCLQPDQVEIMDSNNEWACFKCLRCKSCGKASVTHYSENELPLCSTCCLQRKKGSFCPVCDACYDDNDYETQMMECAKCGGWVHASCEGLNAEKYQILSYLPDAVDFVCKNCHQEDASIWKRAIQNQIEQGQKAVLNEIRKHQAIRDLMTSKSLPDQASSCPPLDECGIKQLYKYKANKNHVDDVTELKGEQEHFTPSYPLDDQGTDKTQVMLSETPSAKTHLKTEPLKKINGYPSVELWNLKQHSWWGPKVQNLLLEQKDMETRPDSSDSIKDLNNDINRDPYESFALQRNNDHINREAEFKKMEDDVSNGALKTISDFHFAIKKFLDCAGLRKDEREQLAEIYNRSMRAAFEWFDPGHPLKYHDSSPLGEKMFPCPSDDHDYVREDSSSSKETSEPYSSKLEQRTLQLKKDLRRCSLCRQKGDLEPSREGRLVYYRQNEWIHLNCALWSSEVYEEDDDGALKNVGQALSRGMKLKCSFCGNRGATTGCCHSNCENNYHFGCALDDEAEFKEDRTVYCTKHKKLYENKKPAGSFIAPGTLHIDLEAESKRKSKPVDLSQVKVYIGSLAIESLGYIAAPASDFEIGLVPVGFSCSRLFWSIKNPSKLTRYNCRTKLVREVRDTTPLSSDKEKHVVVNHSENEHIGLEKLKEFRKSLRAKELIEVGRSFYSNLTIPPSYKKILPNLKIDFENEETSSVSPNFTKENPTQILSKNLNDLEIREHCNTLCVESPAKKLNKAVENVIKRPSPVKRLEFNSFRQDDLDIDLNMTESELEIAPGESDLITAILRDADFAEEIDFPSSHKVLKGNVESHLKDDQHPIDKMDFELWRTWFNQYKKKKLSEVSVQCYFPFEQHVFDMDIDYTDLLRRSDDEIEKEVEFDREDALQEFIENSDDVLNLNSKGKIYEKNIEQIKGEKQMIYKVCQDTRQRMIEAKENLPIDLPELRVDDTLIKPKKLFEDNDISPSNVLQLDGAGDDEESNEGEAIQECWTKTEEEGNQMSHTANSVEPTSDEGDQVTSEPNPEDEVAKVISNLPQSDIEDHNNKLIVNVESETLKQGGNQNDDNKFQESDNRSHNEASKYPYVEVDTNKNEKTEKFNSYNRHNSSSQEGKHSECKSDCSGEISQNKIESSVEPSKTSDKEKASTQPEMYQVGEKSEEIHTSPSNYFKDCFRDSKQSEEKSQSIGEMKHDLHILTKDVPQNTENRSESIEKSRDVFHEMEKMDLQNNQLDQEVSKFQTEGDKRPNDSSSETITKISAISSEKDLPETCSLMSPTGEKKEKVIGESSSEITNFFSEHDASSESSPRKDFSIAGILSPPLNTEGSIQMPVKVENQISDRQAEEDKGSRKTRNTDEVYIDNVQSSKKEVSGEMTSQGNVFIGASQGPTSAPLFVQNVISNSAVTSSFTASFQQSSGRGLQYVASIPNAPLSTLGISHLPPTGATILQPLQSFPGAIGIVPNAAQLQVTPQGYFSAFPAQQYSFVTPQGIIVSQPQQQNVIGFAPPSPYLSSQIHPPTLGPRTVIYQPAVTIATGFGAQNYPTPHQVMLPSPIVQTSQQHFHQYNTTLSQPSQNLSQPSMPLNSQAIGSSTSHSSRKIARVQPQPSKPLKPLATKPMTSQRQSSSRVDSNSGVTPVDPIKALSNMASHPMSNQSGRSTGSEVSNNSRLTITHGNSNRNQVDLRETSDHGVDIDVTGGFDSKTDESPRKRRKLIENQRSVGTQARIGAPVKVLTPRPWRGATETSELLSNQATALTNYANSGVSADDSCSNSSSVVVLSRPGSSESFERCENQRNQPRLSNDDEIHDMKTPLVLDEHDFSSSSSSTPISSRASPNRDLESADDFQVSVKSSHSTSIKMVFGKRDSSGSLKVEKISIKDGQKNQDSIGPETAIRALKAKSKSRKGRLNRPADFVANLDGRGRIPWNTNDFVNEVEANVNVSEHFKPHDTMRELREQRSRAERSDNQNPQIMFEVKAEDGGFSAESTDLVDLWTKIFEAVQEARGKHSMKPLAFNPLGELGLQMLGLTNNAVIYLLEQLPGARGAEKYTFKYHNLDLVEEPLKENPSGCARTETYKTRKPYDMFSWLASRHRSLPDPSKLESMEGEIQLSNNRRATSLDLPMAMRFRHLATNAKEAVGVLRSEIHGRGLYCKRTIQSGEMVIEYAGEEIRAELTDKREKYYESKGIGCYMFKIDDDTVVDATMKGNAARFINHSCDPNCYSKIVEIFGKKHIIIFALRKIYPGEELTYDYKFPIEDVKLPCNCGARKCRKYMN